MRLRQFMLGLLWCDAVYIGGLLLVLPAERAMFWLMLPVALAIGVAGLLALVMLTALILRH
ncbi:MAG: hypothetical protein L0H70_10490 [Xanthomonadales bacterium]|nr:hypothetical protein [Xanthomonadales bacterium]